MSQLYGFCNYIKKKSGHEAFSWLLLFGFQSRQTWYRISFLSFLGWENIHTLELESGGKGSGYEITFASHLPGGTSQIVVSLIKPSISICKWNIADAPRIPAGGTLRSLPSCCLQELTATCSQRSLYLCSSKTHDLFASVLTCRPALLISVSLLSLKDYFWHFFSQLWSPLPMIF